MKIAISAGTRAGRLILAGLITLAVSACAAPDRAQSVALSASSRTEPVARTAPVDPVKAIGDALEQRMIIMVGTAQDGVFAAY